jgi:hypothetical protein
MQQRINDFVRNNKLITVWWYLKNAENRYIISFYIEKVTEPMPQTEAEGITLVKELKEIYTNALAIIFNGNIPKELMGFTFLIAYADAKFININFKDGKFKSISNGLL